MNIVDLCIVAVIGASILFGMYRGFVSSILSAGGCLLSLGLSVWLYPMIAGPIQANGQLNATLLNYTDALTRMGDQSLAGTVVSQAQGGLPDLIQRVLARVNLPSPIAEVLARSLSGQVYGADATVQDYVSQTIVTTFVNIFSFLITFLVIFLALSLVLGAVRAIFRLPVLKQMDTMAGAVLGLIRGVALVFVLFTLVPVVETVIPMEAVRIQIDQSSIAGFFNSGALVSAILGARPFT